MQSLIALCKSRGFIFPGSEIYGGLANTWDLGPLGVALANNIKQLWWKTFVQGRADMVGMDGGIFMHPKIWEASGHLSSFTDPSVDCKTCKRRYRADHLLEDKVKVDVEGKTTEEMTKILAEANLACPNCGNRTWTDVRVINMMFPVLTGKIGEEERVYLRPETAQAIFVQFKNVMTATRSRIPFGIAQIGKAFRNEITPGNFIFRTIEFEQMEIEYFIRAEMWEQSFDAWTQAVLAWIDAVGISRDRVTLYDVPAEKRAHYSKRTIDFMYEFPFGVKELYGLAYRTDYDLKRHSEMSGKDLSYRDPQTNETLTPHVIEPSFGVQRTMLAVLLDAYTEESTTDAAGKTDTRVVLKIAPSIAPVTAAVFALEDKPELTALSSALADTLRKRWSIQEDRSGSIGKRYRRQDEIGTPFCITIDFESISDHKVTIRDRDTMQQERIDIDAVVSYLASKLSEIE